MEDIELKPQVSPFVADFPPHLKDPANFEKIQKVILESLASKHSHSEVLEWATCPPCQKRFAERSDILRKLGFPTPAHYRMWVRIHTKIKERVALPKYNAK